MNQNRDRARRALAALRAADQAGMGRVAGGMGAEATDRLADLDAVTTSYRAWSPTLIPGVLQTPVYTSDAIKRRTPSLDGGEVARRAEHRGMRAQHFLARHTAPVGPCAWFVIGDRAITQPTLNPLGHAEQLRHLLAVEQGYHNIKISVLRSDQLVRAAAEPFSISALDPGPVVGHLESLIGGWYTVVKEDVSRLHSAFSDLVGWAMSLADSREFIQEELATCWGHITEHDSSSPLTPTPTTASTSPVPTPAPSE